MYTLIEIEGAEYSGKTSLAKSLQEKLGYFTARIPGTSPLGEQLRTIVKTYKFIDSATPLGIALAQMSDTYRYLINKNENIITDRGLISSWIYQGYMQNCISKHPILFKNIIETINNIIISSFDYYKFVLDINVDTLLERKAIRDKEEGIDVNDSFDNLDRKTFDNLCKYYAGINNISFFNPDKTFIIDGNQSKEAVLNTVLTKLKDLKII